MSIAKYQHLIPATYLKSWCINNTNTVRLKNKKSREISNRNIHNIMGENYFHSITVKSLMMDDGDLEKIFNCLNDYKVVCEGTEITANKDLRDKFYKYDDWQIYFKNNTLISKAKKNSLKKEIEGFKDNEIENKWSSKYENEWQSFVDNIKERINNRQEDKIDEYRKGYLVKWIISLDWRSIKSNDTLNESFKMIDEIFNLSEIKLDNEERCIKSCDNANSEIKHNYKISTFREFLNDKGKLYKYAKDIMCRTSVHFYISKGKKFITTDNPSFKIYRKDGHGYVMAVSPNIVVALESNKGENKYYVSEVSNYTVNEINKIIQMNCDEYIILN